MRLQTGFTMLAGRALACALVWFATAAVDIPADVRVQTSDRTLSFTSGVTTISSATLCPGFAFDQFGATGPKFSPDFHWVLVDVLGPFLPGNVARTHVLVEVATGAMVRSPQFPAFLGIPGSLDSVAWASGQRQTLAYKDGSSAVVREPPLHPIPEQHCT